MGIEIISRRVHSYVDAYAVNPQKPNLGSGELLRGGLSGLQRSRNRAEEIHRATAEKYLDLQLAAIRVRDQRAGLAADRGNSWGNYDDTAGGEVALKAKAKSKGRARQLQGGAAGG